MRVALMQPYFLPYGGYFALLRSADQIVFLDSDQYVKRRWMNRCRFAFSGGVGWLTIPVRAEGGSRKTICQTELHYPSREFAACSSTLEKLRKRSPVSLELTLETYVSSGRDLATFNIGIIDELYKKIFGQRLRHVLMSELPAELSDGSYLERAVRTTKFLGGSTYLNASGGKDLYFQRDFDAAGVRLEFMPSYVESPEDELSVLGQAAPDLATLRNRISEGCI